MNPNKVHLSTEITDMWQNQQKCIPNLNQVIYTKEDAA